MRQCKYCNAIFPDHANFCGKCGKKLPAAAAAEESMQIPHYMAIDIGPDSIYCGVGFIEREIFRTIPLAETVRRRITPQNRTTVFTEGAVTYIRDHDGFRLPDWCVAAVPYLTCLENAQIESTLTKIGIAMPDVMKRISAFAFMVSQTQPIDRTDNTVLLVAFNRACCEIAAANYSDGVSEMLGVVQRQITIDAPINMDLFRKDVEKVIDSGEVKRIDGVYVTGALPSEYGAMLEQLFHTKCIQLPSDSVLRGLMLRCRAKAGLLKDALLLDINDYDICVGQQVLVQNATTIPVTRNIEFNYHTARPDKCIDIYIKKNNMVLDVPQHLKLSVKQLLTPGQKTEKLVVRGSIDRRERLWFKIENQQIKKKVEYNWEEISRMLRGI